MNQYNKHGFHHGPWTYYCSDNKTIRYTINYINGAYHGEYRCYHLNGNLHYNGYVDKDKDTGLWRYFTNNNIEYKNEYYII